MQVFQNFFILELQKNKQTKNHKYCYCPDEFKTELGPFQKVKCGLTFVCYKAATGNLELEIPQ